MKNLIIKLNRIRHSIIYPLLGLLALIAYISGCIYAMILYP